MTENQNLHNVDDTVEETPNEKEIKFALEEQWSEEKPQESTSGETTESAESVSELEKLRAERDEYLNDLKRLQAEFDNYRKRMQKDRAEMTQFLLQNLITRLLDVVESLERALKTETSDVESYKAGVQMVYQQLLNILAEQGLSRIETVGQLFDPNLHEAVMQIPTGEHQPGTVVAEFSPGYLLRERVLKAPKVQVSIAPPAGTES